MCEVGEFDGLRTLNKLTFLVIKSSALITKQKTAAACGEGKRERKKKKNTRESAASAAGYLLIAISRGEERAQGETLLLSRLLSVPHARVRLRAQCVHVRTKISFCRRAAARGDYTKFPRMRSIYAFVWRSSIVAMRFLKRSFFFHFMGSVVELYIPLMKFLILFSDQGKLYEIFYLRHIGEIAFRFLILSFTLMSEKNELVSWFRSVKYLCYVICNECFVITQMRT